MVSLGSAAKIIQRPNTGKSDNSGTGLEEAGQVENRDGLFSDAFLSLEDLVLKGVLHGAQRITKKREEQGSGLHPAASKA